MPTANELLALRVATLLLGGFFVVLIGGFVSVGAFARDGKTATRGCWYVLLACFVILLLLFTLIGND